MISLILIIICSICLCISVKLRMRNGIIHSYSARNLCLSMKISTINDKINTDSYRKKSSKSKSIIVVNKANNSVTKANSNILGDTSSNSTVIPTLNTESLSQYIGLLVLTAKGLNVTTNNKNVAITNSSFIKTVNESNFSDIYSLNVYAKSTNIAVPNRKNTEVNSAITLLHESPIVFQKFNLNDAGKIIKIYPVRLVFLEESSK